jgi:uncharacterized membrane protein YfcA
MRPHEDGSVSFWLGFLSIGAAVFLSGMVGIFLAAFIVGYDDPLYWAIAFPVLAAIAFAFALWRWKKDAHKYPLSDDVDPKSFEAGIHAARIGCGLLPPTSRRP